MTKPVPDAAAVSDPLTARQLSALAAGTLDDARKTAIGELCEDAHDRSLALVHVARAYTELAVAVATNVHMQPEPKESDR